MNTNHETRFVQANGLNFFVGTAGNGPWLLFLTGSNADLRKPNSPLESPLVEHFSVITYDQRGMGQSDKPDTAYSMLDYAHDAIAVLDALGQDRVHVVGYSFGGMVAQELAIATPERVERLALLATTAGGDTGSSYPIHEFSALSKEEGARRSLEVADLRFTPAWQSAHPEPSSEKIQLRIQARSEYQHEKNAIEGTARQLQARALHNTANRLNQIQAPTLVLAGIHDGQAAMSAQLAMASRIPNCINAKINGSHGMLWENRECFDRLIDFLQR